MLPCTSPLENEQVFACFDHRQITERQGRIGIAESD